MIIRKTDTLCLWTLSLSNDSPHSLTKSYISQITLATMCHLEKSGSKGTRDFWFADFIYKDQIRIAPQSIVNFIVNTSIKYVLNRASLPSPQVCLIAFC